MNDKFETVHIWSEELALKNEGRYTPKLISKSKYESEMMSSWNSDKKLKEEETSAIRYFLCSSAVVEHFPFLEKSKPFKSGYTHDSECFYYVISTKDFNVIEKYYTDVIEPYNNNSNVSDIDFWLRECCDSNVINAPKGSLTECKTYGIFNTIEKIWGLTNERNRAYAIYKMAEYYGISPIEFIDKVIV